MDTSQTSPTEKREPYKKILSIDFDGVIHSYTTGWKDVDIAKDPPVPGAAAFLLEASKHFQLQIFSSRSNSLLGRQCMRNYCISMMHEHFKQRGASPENSDWAHASSWVYQWLQFPTEKGPAFLSIDDRAMTFDGTWPDIQTLLDFQPWNKKEKILT